MILLITIRYWWKKMKITQINGKIYHTYSWIRRISIVKMSILPKAIYRLNQTYLLVLEGLLERQGVAVSDRGEKDTGSRSSGKYSLAWALPDSTIGPTKELDRLQCWVTSGQTTKKKGSQSHPSADKQIKVLRSSAHQRNSQRYPPPVPPIRKLTQAS